MYMMVVYIHSYQWLYIHESPKAVTSTAAPARPNSRPRSKAVIAAR